MARSSTEEQIAEIERGLLLDYQRRIRRFLSDCESPIEKLFLAQCMGMGFEPPDLLVWNWLSDTAERIGVVGSRGDDRAAFNRPGRSAVRLPRSLMTGEGHVLLIQPTIQLATGKHVYRPDFVLLNQLDTPLKPIAIELDGHDFHERTKEQARRDKSRDRNFTNQGWKVLRFTGSEVYADPELCVLEAAWPHILTSESGE